MCEFEAATQSGNRRKVARCGHSSMAASRRNEFLEVPSIVCCVFGGGLTDHFPKIVSSTFSVVSGTEPQVLMRVSMAALNSSRMFRL